MQIFEHDPDALADYMSVPSGFWVLERYVVNGRTLDGPIETTPWFKNYDHYEDERPDRLPDRFDVRPWGFLGAKIGEQRVGGAIVARDTPSFRLLEGRNDLAYVLDLRVHPAHTRHGIGKGLWLAAEGWARRHDAIEIRVETQDVNAPACRFYQAMGCRLHAVHAGAYGPELDEAQILWSKTL